MNGIVGLILGVVFIGMVVLLCLFSCILASQSDNYWEEIKREMEKQKNERH